MNVCACVCVFQCAINIIVLICVSAVDCTDSPRTPNSSVSLPLIIIYTSILYTIIEVLSLLFKVVPSAHIVPDGALYPCTIEGIYR